MAREQIDIAVIVGSLRAASVNRRVALALAALAPEDLALEIVEIRDLPLYDEDLDTDTPPVAWTAFRERVKAADAVLFVTPEYNRSVPGGLKNAIDVGSRPYGQSAFAGKPAAVVTVSPGAIGGFGANHHLRQALVFLDMPTLGQPEMYISGAFTMFNEDGSFAKQATQDYLRSFISTYATWVARLRQG